MCVHAGHWPCGCLGQGSAGTGPETRLGGSVVPLGRDLRNHQLGAGEVSQGRAGAKERRMHSEVSTTVRRLEPTPAGGRESEQTQSSGLSQQSRMVWGTHRPLLPELAEGFSQEAGFPTLAAIAPPQVV